MSSTPADQNYLEEQVRELLDGYELLTHYEIESLPSGFWGYHHFPRLARTFAHWGHDDAAVLDDASDLDEFVLLILPDTVVITAKLAAKLPRYYRQGGTLI